MKKTWLSLGLLIALTQCQQQSAPVRAATEPSPLNLVTVIVIDQMRGDDLARYDALWNDGLRQLVDQGRWYTQAFHAHGNTETASGHASIATGLTAKDHGIPSQRFFDAEQGKKVNVCDFGPGNCGANVLLAPALGDRLKVHSPESKVVSLAQKARSAMLMGGKQPDLAMWFGDGAYVVGHGAAYDTLEEELQKRFQRIAGPTSLQRVWELPPLPEPFASRPDDRPEERDGGTGTTFPHRLPDTATETKLYKAWRHTPDSDRALVDFVLETVDHMSLGRGPATDLLMVSLSATDVIGHAFGPESLERAAAYVSLDKELGRLLRGLSQRFGDGVQVALTSDHGVTPMPHASRALGHAAERVLTRELKDVAEAALQKRFGEGKYIKVFAFPFMSLHGLPDEQRREGAEIAAAALREHPGVYGAWANHQLAESEDPIAALMAESVYPNRSGDVAVVLKPLHLPHYDPESACGADHGSPWDSDRHVPIVLWGPHIQHTKVDVPVVVPQLTRSLAQTLGLSTEWGDGTVLP